MGYLARRHHRVWEGTRVITSSGVILPLASGGDSAEVLISKSTWPLKVSGLVFAGLLVLGRSASYGNVTWTPTYHGPGSPLIVQTSGVPAAPAKPILRSADPAALGRQSAADEVVTFHPGNSGDGEDGEGGGGDHHSNSGENGHNDVAAGSATAQSAGSAAGGGSAASAANSGQSGQAQGSTTTQSAGSAAGGGSVASAQNSGQTIQQTTGSVASAASALGTTVGVPTSGGPSGNLTGTGAQASQLANTGAGAVEGAKSAPVAGGALAGLLALLATVWIKRREILSKLTR